MTANAPDYYRILHISPQAAIAEIKAAFHQLARECHPDLHPNNPQAEARFKDISQAYEVLRDPIRRQAYHQLIGLDAAGLPSDLPDAYYLYEQGVQQTIARDYPAAIASYTQALNLQPDLAEAYLRRGQVRFVLGEDRGVLEDCQAALELRPELTQAHYYRGRTRYRLGYTQSAIGAYSEAIALDADHADAHYHRGVAYHDLRELDRALQDIQHSAQLFQDQGDGSGYQLAIATLRRLKRSPLQHLQSFAIQLRQLARDTITFAPWLLINPTGTLDSGRARLSVQRLGLAGIGHAVVATLFWMLAIGLNWSPGAGFGVNLAINHAIGFGLASFCGLMLVSASARWIWNCAGAGMAGDRWVVGSAMVPIAAWSFISALFGNLGGMAIFLLIGGCYSLIILHHGCRQIYELPPAIAPFVATILLLTSTLLGYLVLIIG